MTSSRLPCNLLVTFLPGDPIVYFRLPAAPTSCASPKDKFCQHIIPKERNEDCVRILTPLDGTICLIEPHAASWVIFSLRDHANVSLLHVSPLRGVGPRSRIIVAPGN